MQKNLFDITKLSEASIRKYATYFKIQEQDLQKLKILVVQHFNNDLSVDLDSTVQEFLSLKKNQTERQFIKRPRINSRVNNNSFKNGSQKNN